MRWTQPFHGVQHLEDLPSGHQITLVAYESFVEVYHCFKSFTPTAEEDFDTVEQAQLWGETQARQFLPIKKEYPQCESGFAQD